MKAGITIQELATEIARRKDAKADIVAPTKQMHIDVIKDVPHITVADKFQYGINSIAHGQIAAWADIPKKYYDKLLGADPYLLATNVNAWFGRSDDKRMIRALDGIARAFPSQSYRPLENEDLAEAVFPPILEMGLDVHSAQITDRRLYIKAVDPKVNRALRQMGAHLGDGGHTIVRVLAAALTVQNSEVCEGSLGVYGGTYDGWCSNLATYKEQSMRKAHIGTKHDLGENTYAMLSNDSRRKADVALWAAVGDVVRGVFDRARFDALVDKIEGTTKEKIEGDVVQVVHLSARKFGINETQEKSVLDHLIKGGDLTRFGLHNAFTRASQDIEDYDTATDFERIGAQVIELPANEWRQIANAA